METESINIEMAAKFDRILDLEDALRISKAVGAFQTAGTPDFVKDQRAQSRSADQGRLFAALDALTAQERELFGQYRIEARK